MLVDRRTARPDRQTDRQRENSLPNGAAGAGLAGLGLGAVQHPAYAALGYTTVHCAEDVQHHGPGLYSTTARYRQYSTDGSPHEGPKYHSSSTTFPSPSPPSRITRATDLIAKAPLANHLPSLAESFPFSLLPEPADVVCWGRRKPHRPPRGPFLSVSLSVAPRRAFSMDSPSTAFVGAYTVGTVLQYLGMYLGQAG